MKPLILLILALFAALVAQELGLGKEQRAGPFPGTALIDHALVQPRRIAGPELDGLRHHAKAGPERRPRDRGVLEAVLDLEDAGVQRRARWQSGALQRGPRADLRSPGTGREVRV